MTLCAKCGVYKLTAPGHTICAPCYENYIRGLGIAEPAWNGLNRQLCPKCGSYQSTVSGFLMCMGCCVAEKAASGFYWHGIHMKNADGNCIKGCTACAKESATMYGPDDADESPVRTPAFDVWD